MITPTDPFYRYFGYLLLAFIAILIVVGGLYCLGAAIYRSQRRRLRPYEKPWLIQMMKPTDYFTTTRRR